MDKINKLKEIIFNLKMDAIKAKVYEGSCPYSLYIPIDGREIECTLDCEKCRNLFFLDVEKKIREEIEAL